MRRSSGETLGRRAYRWWVRQQSHPRKFLGGNRKGCPADQYGLAMSICHWVRSELGITAKEIPLEMRENLLGHGIEEAGVCKPAIFAHPRVLPE